MPKLYRWENVVLGILAVFSFVAGYMNGGFIDAVMAVAINTLIVFVLFKVGNKIFISLRNNTNEVKLRQIRDKIGITLTIAFLLLLWGAYIGSLILWILYLIFPDTWIDPLAHTFQVIYPGQLEQHECVPNYMGGCD